MMNSNLQFYGATALIGFVISLAFRKEDQTPKWLIFTLVGFPFCWAALGIVMVMTVGDKRIDGFYDVLTYFDAERFLPQNGYARAFGVLAFVFTTYFALLFSLPWRIKNRAYQDDAHNGDKRRLRS